MHPLLRSGSRCCFNVMPVLGLQEMLSMQTHSRNAYLRHHCSKHFHNGPPRHYSSLYHPQQLDSSSQQACMRYCSGGSLTPVTPLSPRRTMPSCDVTSAAAHLNQIGFLASFSSKTCLLLTTQACVRYACSLDPWPHQLPSAVPCCHINFQCWALSSLSSLRRV